LGAAVRNNVTEAGKSLTVARDLAERSRGLLRDRIDPIDHDRAERERAKLKAEAAKQAEQAERHTLARVARAYHERHVEPVRSAKHSMGWINALEQHVPAAIWHAPIDSIAPVALFDFFVSIRRERAEVGKRIAQRLRKIFSDAEFRGWVKGNAAAAAMDQLRGLDFGHKAESFAALPFAEVPAFMRELRTRDAIAAKALLFGVYTWARTGEIIGATWDEFQDLEGSDPRWIIPATRMKMDRPHTVPLVPQAVAILREMVTLGSMYVFPSPDSIGTDAPKPLSNMGMLTLLRRMDADRRTTVHGLCRQSSSTWANELGIARPDVIEAALAHGEANQVRAAYNKAQYLAERRTLLHAWADYVDGRVVATNVIPMQRAA
jgi:integrase